MARSALEPVSEAVYSTLNVSAMTALATGGIYDDVPQDTAYPFVWYTVREADVAGTFGQVFQRCRIVVHCFSQYQGSQQAQVIINKAVDLLRGQTPSVTNYTALQLLHEGSTGLPDEDIGGVKTKHLMAEFELTVSES